MSYSARKCRNYRETVRYGHKRSRQTAKAVLRGDNGKIVRGLGYYCRLPQAPLEEIPMEGREGIEDGPDQARKRVASNRCGNDCGRRAEMEDYLCRRCR